MTRRPRGARAGLIAIALAALLALPAGGARAAAAADVGALRLRTVEGRVLELPRLLERGPVLLDFWATWCKPCLASLPEIEALHRAWADRGLTVVGVSVDGPRNFPKVRPFASRLGLTYPVVLDEDGALQRRHQVRAIPTAVLIAPDGAVALVHVGYRPGETAALEDAIAALLAPADADSAR